MASDNIIYWYKIKYSFRTVLVASMCLMLIVSPASASMAGSSLYDDISSTENEALQTDTETNTYNVKTARKKRKIWQI